MKKSGLGFMPTSTLHYMNSPQKVAKHVYMSIGKVKSNESLKRGYFLAGQFLSRGFVVLLRKSIPQNRNLKTAA